MDTWCILEKDLLSVNDIFSCKSLISFIIQRGFICRCKTSSVKENVEIVESIENSATWSQKSSRQRRDSLKLIRERQALKKQVKVYTTKYPIYINSWKFFFLISGPAQKIQYLL